jgi:protein phosphatase 1 regulatory subunit 11
MNSNHNGAENSSATTTITTNENEGKQSKILILKLREKQSKSITWTSDTIDNEFLDTKSSKRCCIYHKSKKFGESDSDESDEDTNVAAKSQPKPNQPPNFQRHHA